MTVTSEALPNLHQMEHEVNALTDLITQLVMAHSTGSRIAPPDWQLTRNEVLYVQQQVAKALGPVAGFKVGRVPHALPILAPLPACYTRPDGVRITFHDRIGVELEVGFEVLRPLSGAALPDRPQDYLRPCVVLELVDSRFHTLDLPADAKFCDFQLNRGLVVGAANDKWDGSDFTTVQATLMANDEAILDGLATVPGGSALENLAALLENIGDHCGGVQKGHILITGSLNGLPFVQENQHIKGYIQGLGTVAAFLDAAELSL